MAAAPGGMKGFYLALAAVAVIGAGLLVYQITKQLGGDISVESEPGLTTVSIEIPHHGYADKPTAPVPA